MGDLASQWAGPRRPSPDSNRTANAQNQTTAASSGTVQLYDAAGNTVRDPANLKLVYDA